MQICSRLSIINILYILDNKLPPSCLYGILALRSHDFWEMTNSKTRVRFVYVLPEVLHSDFFIWNKIFIQPIGKYFTYINQKCYFLQWLFQLRWTLIQHFQVFPVNKLNTCFAVKSHLSKVMWPDLKARIPTKTRWQD